MEIWTSGDKVSFASSTMAVNTDSFGIEEYGASNWVYRRATVHSRVVIFP